MSVKMLLPFFYKESFPLAAVQGGGICGIATSPSNQTQGECPGVGVRILTRLGEARFLLVTNCTKKKKDSKMFCSLLSTSQMSCKSTPCQWSAHVPLLIFRQLSAQLSPGYRDSKFSPCLCCLSPKSLSPPGLRDLISQLLHETFPVCSPGQNCVVLQHSPPLQDSAVPAPVGAYKSPVIIRDCALEIALWVRCML